MRATIVTACFTAVFMVATQASAAPIPIQDLYDPTDVLFDKDGAACTGANPGHTAAGDTSSAATCNSLSYTHSLLPEFDPSLHDLLSATLTLFFHDDEGGSPSEEFVLSLDGGASMTQEIELGSYSYNVSTLMNPDGLLQVSLSRTGPTPNNANDFYFERSVVDATYDRASEVSQVPEPASLLLLGAGLAGVGRQFRQRRRNQRG